MSSRILCGLTRIPLSSFYSVFFQLCATLLSNTSFNEHFSISFNCFLNKNTYVFTMFPVPLYIQVDKWNNAQHNLFPLSLRYLEIDSNVIIAFIHIVSSILLLWFIRQYQVWINTLVFPAFVTILSTGISWQMRFLLKLLVVLNTSNANTDKCFGGNLTR